MVIFVYVEDIHLSILPENNADIFAATLLISYSGLILLTISCHD